MKQSTYKDSKTIKSEEQVTAILRSQLVQEDDRMLGEAGPQILNKLDGDRVADLAKQSEIAKSFKDSSKSALNQKL